MVLFITSLVLRLRTNLTVTTARSKTSLIARGSGRLEIILRLTQNYPNHTFCISPPFVVNIRTQPNPTHELRRILMEWKDLEKMTVLKLREEALKFPEIEGVHGKNKEQLMDEIARVLGIVNPHAHLAEKIVHTKSDLKHKIQELKSERDKLVQTQDHKKLHDVRREMHELKHEIR